MPKRATPDGIGRRIPLMARTTSALRSALEAKAAESGLSLVQEVERRLAASLRDEDIRAVVRQEMQAVIADAGYVRFGAWAPNIDPGQRSLDRLPLEIEQQPGLTVAQIAARVRQYRIRLERAGGFLGLVVIDHIGLIKASKRYAGNRVQELTEITGSLKGLAKELGAPVLGLSQLSRAVENRDDKRPKLADLRDSGSIEQDADVVIGLFREEYYLEHIVDLTPEEADRLARARQRLELEILKQRGGPTARIDCFCDVACNVLAESA